MENKQPPALVLNGIHKHYGDIKAVNGVDLTIEKGEIIAFLGPNGAGKTTTIDMILGLQQPTQGSLSVFGLHPHQAIRRGLLSAVMQTGGLLRDYTVAETLQFMAVLYGRRTSVADVMERAGIDNVSSSPVRLCSGGEQQRLRFAIALLSDPELLILDEPTQGMDVEARRNFWLAIRQDAALGRTIVFATHYLEEADSYANRIVLIRKGEIVADGTPMEVKSKSSDKMVRAHVTDIDKDNISSLPGVHSLDFSNGKLEVRCSDSDFVARHLLLHTNATNLEIALAGLEEVFLNLTHD